jgi:glutathione S-transferase
MWVRRIDLNILEPMANGFRFGPGLEMFQDRIHCIPQAAADLAQTAQEKLAWLDGLMAGKTYVCGNRLTLADTCSSLSSTSPTASVCRSTRT